jgi:hypothetical protein
MNSIDYKVKYLKYKAKYLKLKNKLIQKGGAESIIPKDIPKTNSYLFMPLIFYSIDNSSITLPDGFIEAVNKAIRNVSVVFPLPFNNAQGFFNYIKVKLNSKGFRTTCDVSKFRDVVTNPYHISGTKQEEILENVSDIITISMITGITAEIIPALHGKKFVYNF